jgi:MarR family transcriptional regulator, organic hydroperoxide resistance regulator
MANAGPVAPPDRRTTALMSRPLRQQPDLGSARLPDVLQFMQLLWAVVHGMERRSKSMRVKLGVTGQQRLVLRVVGLFPELSAGDLAAILHVHPSTLTGILQRLIAQRLLKRAEDGRDRRRVVLSLTARGKQLNGVDRGTVEEGVRVALRGVSARERVAIRRVLVRIAEHLDPDSVRGSAGSRRSS